MKRIYTYRFVTSRADFSTSPFGKLFRCFCRSIYAIGCCTISGFIFISSIWVTDNLFGCYVCHCLVINMSFVWLKQQNKFKNQLLMNTCLSIIHHSFVYVGMSSMYLRYILFHHPCLKFRILHQIHSPLVQSFSGSNFRKTFPRHVQ